VSYITFPPQLAVQTSTQIFQELSGHLPLPSPKACWRQKWKKALPWNPS